VAAEHQIDDDDPEAAYRALMRKAEELAAERGITPAQAFEQLLVARDPELRMASASSGGQHRLAVERIARQASLAQRPAEIACIGSEHDFSAAELQLERLVSGSVAERR
jgi:hypothetical protein